MTCHLSDSARRLFEQRAQWSCMSDEPRDGYFRLFNKNGDRTTFVKPVGQLANAMVWIVEADEPIDPYFRNVLVPQ